MTNKSHNHTLAGLRVLTVGQTVATRIAAGWLAECGAEVHQYGDATQHERQKKAKPEAVEKARADHAHHVAEVARLEAALARLG